MSNVIVKNTAAGHQNMTTCICNAFYDDEHQIMIIVSCIKLDDINFDTLIKIIKIDVQGFEMQVLQGGEKTLEKHRPVMVIEFEDQCMNFYNYSSKELVEYYWI